MTIELYNTLSEKKETFTPSKKGVVSMYQCGPTVYDTAHIGNLRTYVFNDIVRRVFEYNGFDVDQVMNITDIDDKTIKKSQAEKKSLHEVTTYYESLFLNDLKALNILIPKKILRATEHIPAMIEMIEKLLVQGTAYKASDGIYFSITKSADYGKLAHIEKRNETVERIANDEYDKENPRDFALWKFHTPEDDDVFFDAPFGKGRPGWHIECSAMSMEALGETIDVHTGGTDLIFPHHTNEIAQSEAVTHKTFVRYWLHGAFMNVNDEKMAKSKGNFLKLADLQEVSISPLAFRFWLLSAHYRTQINFTVEAVKAAQTALIRLIEHFAELGDATGVVNALYKERFTNFINNDFDMPQAVALAFELMKDKTLSPEDKRATMLHFDTIFGLNLSLLDMTATEDIPAEVSALADAREEARKAKEFEKADALRQEILSRGFEVKDTPSGPKIVKM